MKRLMLIVPVIALVASCGQKPEQAATEDIKTFQVVAEEAGEIAQDAGAAVLSDTTTLGGEGSMLHPPSASRQHRALRSIIATLSASRMRRSPACRKNMPACVKN